MNRDPRIREFVYPTRIVWQAGESASTEAVERLLMKGSGQATVWGAPGLILRQQNALKGFCLDFGREIYGGVQIVSGSVKDPRPAHVRVRFGESVSEAMGEPNNDHGIHDWIVALPFYGSIEIGQTGFRFVRIDLVDPDSEVEIQEIRGIGQYYDLEYKGSFQSSDERLNRIWQTGAYTVHLCMQDHVWDGLKRDRLVWMDHLHPAMMVINSVFGQVDVFERTLDFARAETPLPKFFNTISTNSLWWILIQHGWFLYQGDMAFLDRQREYLLGLLEILGNCVDQAGREKLPEVRFIDWPTVGDEQAIHAGLQSLMIMALDAATELCQWLDERKVAQRCRTSVQLLQTHRPLAGQNKRVNALRVLSGQADPVQANQTLLVRKPFLGLSTFMGYYVLQARAAAGDIDGCLHLIRKYWGAMLDLGATTFWETFDMRWAEEDAGRIDEIVPWGRVDIHAERGAYFSKGLRQSLCHAWAGGPTAWLSEHVLGVRPLEPGCAVLAVRPVLGDLEWVEGTFPTPKGVVRIRHAKGRGGKMASEIDAPEGVCIKKQ